MKSLETRLALLWIDSTQAHSLFQRLASGGEPTTHQTRALATIAEVPGMVELVNSRVARRRSLIP